MPKTLSSTLTAAIAANVTTPIYLARIGFSAETYDSTWGAAIAYDSKSYIASGMSIPQLSDRRAVMELPATNTWLGLILNEDTRDKDIWLYRHYKDVAASPTSDTVLVFRGIMDEATIDDRIRIEIIEASSAKQFPPTLIDKPTFNFLPVAGTRIEWGNDTVIVS